MSPRLLLETKYPEYSCDDHQCLCAMYARGCMVRNRKAHTLAKRIITELVIDGTPISSIQADTVWLQFNQRYRKKVRKL